jgi:hypothetical protein
MATTAQTIANKANAQRSTGPKSPEGKAVSATNSTKDGFTAKFPVVDPGEDEHFARFKATLIQDTRPEGALEEEFFDRLLTYGWNLRRARAAESRLLAAVDLADEVDSARLLRVARYRRDLERSHDRALRELRHLQTQRAILLQQQDSIIAGFSAIAPLAELSRITTHTDPMIHAANNPMRPPQTSLAPSRAKARRGPAGENAQNEPNPAPLTEDEVIAALCDNRLTTAERDALVELYTRPPQC